MAQDYYYYYKGEKMPLTLNESKVCVSISKDNKDVSERIRANVQVQDMIKDEDLFDIFIILRSDFEQLSSRDFWEEDAKSVIITSSYLTEDNVEVFATPYLNVRLKKDEDIDLLTSYAEKYKLRIVGNSPLIPLLYALYVTPESDKSPMECANEMFESGDFAASVPDLASYGEADIQGVTTGTDTESSGIYDLQGRRVMGPPTKGLYIQNGKKVIVK
ncbi:MAG: hypothetical protein J6W56_08675 [Prevotella sp.]|nr:hypothetical protein [Prevotella sp.]